jgi:hypothetical protein
MHLGTGVLHASGEPSNYIDQQFQLADDRPLMKGHMLVIDNACETAGDCLAAVWDQGLHGPIEGPKIFFSTRKVQTMREDYMCTDS